MKERGPWRLWSTFLLILAGNFSPTVKCQSSDGSRGDAGDGSPAALGFSGVVQRHDGYVKGETPTIPQTSFSCSAQPYNPGLYADMETQCQVYHVCFEDRQESFLCGPGTNFNQRILACDFWYNFDCQDSPSFYTVNADIGKVPDKLFTPGSVRVTQQPQQPGYPSFPAQPPSVGSYPNRVRVPPPSPGSGESQHPIQPDRPRVQPQQPVEPEFPRVQPQQPIHPQPPRTQQPVRPQPPRIPQEPYEPQPPRIASQPPSIPQRPSYRPEPPKIQPQPPRSQPPRIQPQPPAVRPQPRPDPPSVSIQSQYPRDSQGSGQPPKVRPPPPQQLPPTTQQEEDNGYHFDGYRPSRPVALPPPPPPRAQTPRPVFPPVVSPPRVSRPPLTPVIIRQHEISRPSVPVTDSRSGFHPDSNLKGNTDRFPQQPARIPQPSGPTGTGYPSYPVSQRPVSQRPISQTPVSQRPIDQPRRPDYQPPRTVQQEHVDYVPPPPPPPPQPKEPSRPYVPPPPPPQQPKEPSRPYVPPPPPPQQPRQPSRPYVPPPPPPSRPKEPSRPSTTYVPPPPPPPPVQQEVTVVSYPKTPQQPSRPVHVPPPVAQKPVDRDYGKLQPPVSPSIIREHQKPGIPPSQRPPGSTGSRQPPPHGSTGSRQPPPHGSTGSRQPPPHGSTGSRQPPPHGSTGSRQPPPHGSTGSRQPPPHGSTGSRQPQPHGSTGSRQPPPQRPKPVFPPASDHPNANIKGGPGYQQPPPQIPKFEPTRISRPSAPQGGYVPPQTSVPRPVSSGSSTTGVKPSVGKPSSTSGQGSYKPPQQGVKKPSDPPRSVYQPPIQVRDHPNAEFKGATYDPSISRQPQRVQSPSTPVSGVKRPQVVSSHQQTQRPRAPIVVSRPQPPSLPTTSIKKTSPVGSQVYEKPQPPAPGRVKLPSTTQIQTSRPSQPRFPTHDVIDHPNANVKGSPGYTQPSLQPVGVSRPSGPPSSPSTAYERKTTSGNQGRGSGTGHPSPPHGNVGSVQQVIQKPDYKPSRSSPPSSIKTVSKVNQVTTGVKDSSSYQRPPSSSQHSVLFDKQPKPDYQAGSSYTRGPDIYPKPEFGRPSSPVQPVSTPSRSSSGTKQGSPSQNTITRSQNKPTYPGSSVSVGSGSDVRPDYPFNQVPGHQPPHQRQVFPHRENPDHPNESIKGSGAYRPPPPAGFQAAASEVQEQIVVPEPEPAAASLHGDTGSE